MRLLLALALVIHLNAQVPAGHPMPKSDVTIEVHLKAVKLVEMGGGRDRLVATIPDMIERGKAAMQKQCPDCNPAFFTEWGKRMASRLKIDDFMNVAVRAYETRFTNDELTEFLTVMSSQKTENPVPFSPPLQKKLSSLLPAIMGEITGGCTEIGARLGGEIGAEIEAQHPEYVPARAKSDKP
ncbi:MAG TPA: hypothetical protein VEU96_27090 [Bryobacteraceae bacterium]|nr:hypothetical protein [Bryobacteraceae bacterium]